jgi:hypothetical protein
MTTHRDVAEPRSVNAASAFYTAKTHSGHR